MSKTSYCQMINESSKCFVNLCVDYSLAPRHDGVLAYHWRGDGNQALSNATFLKTVQNGPACRDNQGEAFRVFVIESNDTMGRDFRENQPMLQT
jgi:hypothetical protein